MRGYHKLKKVIKSFRHKGLKRFFETGQSSGIQSKHDKKLKMQLIALHTAQQIEDLDIPAFRLHPLKGNLNGRWSIWVSGKFSKL